MAEKLWVQVQDFLIAKAVYLLGFSILGVPTVIVVLWDSLREAWLGWQILFWLSVSVPLIGIVGLYLRWQKNRSVERIPDLLTELDRIILDYIDQYVPDTSKLSEETFDELAELLGWEIGQLKFAIKHDDKEKASKEINKLTTQYDKRSKKKDQDVIMNLLLIGKLLDENNIGLATLRREPAYSRLHKEIRTLQKRSPTADISSKVNNYFKVSEPLYCMVLGSKAVIGGNQLRALVPVKTRLANELFQESIESNVSDLIAQVRESINKNKEKRDGKP